MPKVCRKHKIEFCGLRCPKCSAPPVVKEADPDEQLPFEGYVVTANSEQLLEVLKKVDDGRTAFLNSLIPRKEE